MNANFRKSLLAGLASAAVATAVVAGDWLSFTDETSARLFTTDSEVGANDVEEKDMAAADFDKDGDQDVVIVRKTPFSVAGGKRNVLFMNVDGVMTDMTASLASDLMDLTDDRDIHVVDVDGDTWLDFITVTTFENQPRVYMNLGEIGGIWQGFDWNPADNRIPAFDPAPKFCSLASGDVDGINGPDLFFVDYENDLEDRLLINDGNGFFTDETGDRMTKEMSDSTFGTDAAILDIDRDGDNDIIKNNSSGSAPPPGAQDPAVIVLYNDGTGNFVHRQEANDDAPYMFEPADFNNDDRIDIYVVDDAQDFYLINNGNDVDGHVIWSKHFVQTSPKTTGFGGNTASGDLNRDGFIDVYVADVDTDIAGCTRDSVALRGRPATHNPGTNDGILHDPLSGGDRTWMPSGTFDMLLVDIDGDGALDVWAGTCSGNSIFMAPNIQIFEDGFESGDTSAWSAAVP